MARRLAHRTDTTANHAALNQNRELNNQQTLDGVISGAPLANLPISNRNVVSDERKYPRINRASHQTPMQLR